MRKPGIALMGLFLIIVAGVAACANGIGGALLLDDDDNITNNERIRELWPPWKPLDVFSRAPGRAAEEGSVSGVSGRPIYNLSFAVNHAIGGGYHVANIAIHIACALLLFAILRRTFAQPRLSGLLGDAAGPAALAAALLWLLHPLQTTSVTYLSQRAESLLGLFILAALFCSIRAFASPRPAGWAASALVSTLLAMGTKEVAVVLPLLILLYDRTFAAGSFRAAFAQRRTFYALLGSTWPAMALLVIAGGRFDSASSTTVSVTPLEYAMTQPGVILHYLRLVFWPDPLVFHYWWPVVRSPVDAIIPAAVVIGLLIGTVAAVRRFPAVGFAAAWFFLILAPSSSIIPIPREIAAEHRMYLPLAAVIALVVGAGVILLRKRSKETSLLPVIAILLMLLLGILTHVRNRDYASPERMWRDTVAKHPENPLAIHNLGYIYASSGRFAEALPCFAAATNLLPEDPMPRMSLGLTLIAFATSAEERARKAEEAGLPAEAVRNWREGHQRRTEAVALFEEVLRNRPRHLDALGHLSVAYAAMNRYDDAARMAETAAAVAREQGRDDLARQFLEHAASWRGNLR